MLYIILISLASIAIVHILSKKSMRVALVAYSIGYVTLMAWFAFVIGNYIYTESLTRVDVMGVGEAMTTNFAEAVNAMSVFSCNTLIVLIGAEISLTIIALCWVFLCGRELTLAIKEFISKRTKYLKSSNSDKHVVYIPTAQIGHYDKIYLRLCRLCN